MLPASFQLVLNRVFAIVALILMSATGAWAGVKVLHSFGRLTKTPASGLIVDAAGNGYGTTAAGGFNNAGTVYQLSATSGYQIIYGFSGSPDGRQPQGNLVIDVTGNLYGTTVAGGTSKNCKDGCGTVFKLTPPSNGGVWTETVLYSFEGGTSDGANPQAGVILDSKGNLFGTTEFGGNQNCVAEGPGCGTVFELEPSQSGWTESVLYMFTNHSDGGLPQCALVFDGTGNLYGTGGYAFEMTPNGDGTWSFNVIYRFDPTKGDPTGAATGVVFDGQGNLYGTSPFGGAFDLGTVFELTQDLGSWKENILHSFVGGSDGANPEAGLVLDAAGNLYGTTYAGGSGGISCQGNGCGTVFELTPNQNGQWTERRFIFPGDASLGRQPTTPLLLDKAGRVYGTTTSGGLSGSGVVFRLAP